MMRERVAPKECEAIRELWGEGRSTSYLMERFDRATKTIHYHAYGDCECDSDIEPGGPRPPDISRDDCRRIRERAREGEAYTNMAKEYDVHTSTIFGHARGRCSHEPGVPPVTENRRGRVTEDMCLEMTYLYAVERLDAGRIIRCIDEKYDRRIRTESTVMYHVMGDCRHDLL